MAHPSSRPTSACRSGLRGPNSAKETWSAKMARRSVSHCHWTGLMRMRRFRARRVARGQGTTAQHSRQM
eukprot:5114976-Prymnesium_polylepis.1